MQTADLALDVLSRAAIYFRAAIGLAITFGVMAVINMAHGEFITMGAYSGHVVQQFLPDKTLSLVVAFPLAFAAPFAAAVALGRLVIRHLDKRPLETLLASFGISIALQQLFQVFSPGIWWIGLRMNRSGSDVQVLQMYSQGVRPCSGLSLRAKL